VAGKFSIEGVFSVQDRASRVVAKIEGKFDRAVRGMNARARAASARLGTMFDAAGKGLKAFQDRASAPMKAIGGDLKMMGAAAAGAAAVAGAGLVQVMSAGMNFEKTLLSAGNKFEAGISKTSDSYKKLSAAAQDVGGKTEFSASQAAGALKELAGAGFTVDQAISALPGTVNLATAAEMELAAATEVAAKSLGAFGLKSKDPVELANNLQRVSDVMAKTDDISSTSIGAIFEAIQEGGAVAKTAGASIETYSTLVAGLADVEEGSKAGTTLKNMFLTLSAPTAEAAAAFDKFGIKTKDAEGNTRDAIAVLGELQRATAKLGTGEKAGVLEQIFGKIPIAGVTTLLDKVPELVSSRDALLNSKGAVDKKATSMRSGGTGAWDNFTSAVEGASLSAFEVVGPDVTAGIESATAAVAKLSAAAMPFLREFVGGLKKGFAEAWPAIKSAVDILFTGFGGKTEWLTRVKDFASTLGKVVAAAVGVAAVLGGMLAASIQVVTGVVNAAIGAWNGFVSGIGAAIFAVDDFLSNVGAKWRAFDFAEWGMQIVRGIANGIKSGASWVMDSIKQLAADMINKFKGAMMIRSPSKKMAELGEFAAAGVGVGWDQEMPAVSKGIERSIAPINALPLGIEKALGASRIASVNSPSLGSDERSASMDPQLVSGGAVNMDELRAAVREELEITIRDESGRAEVTKKPKGANVSLAPKTARSGAP
jgi:TP901 family phage tail tape measure protein